VRERGTTSSNVVSNVSNVVSNKALLDRLARRRTGGQSPRA